MNTEGQEASTFPASMKSSCPLVLCVHVCALHQSMGLGDCPPLSPWAPPSVMVIPLSGHRQVSPHCASLPVLSVSESFTPPAHQVKYLRFYFNKWTEYRLRHEGSTAPSKSEEEREKKRVSSKFEMLILTGPQCFSDWIPHRIKHADSCKPQPSDLSILLVWLSGKT